MLDNQNGCDPTSLPLTNHIRWIFEIHTNYDFIVGIKNSTKSKIAKITLIYIQVLWVKPSFQNWNIEIFSERVIQNFIMMFSLFKRFTYKDCQTDRHRSQSLGSYPFGTMFCPLIKCFLYQRIPIKFIFKFIVLKKRIVICNQPSVC